MKTFSIFRDGCSWRTWANVKTHKLKVGATFSSFFSQSKMQGCRPAEICFSREHVLGGPLFSDPRERPAWGLQTMWGRQSRGKWRSLQECVTSWYSRTEIAPDEDYFISWSLSCFFEMTSVQAMLGSRIVRRWIRIWYETVVWCWRWYRYGYRYLPFHHVATLGRWSERSAGMNAESIPT